MVAAIYARVSTTDQNCGLQLTELHGYADRSDWQYVEYVDDGVSGTKRSRPALDRLMRDARLKKFSVVICWKLDRFGRSMMDLIENIRELDRLGIRFLCPTQGLDTDTKSPTGRLILHILAALAEFERELIVERVNAGIADAKRRGVKFGRPQRDYDRTRVERLRKQGKGWKRIAQVMGLPVSTIRPRSVRKTA